MRGLFFVFGGLGYMGLECLWRGRTHWSMGLSGGLCAMLLYGLFTARAISVWGAFLWSAAVITAVEFLFGFVFNLCLGMGVWDYRRFRHNLYGQICLPYSLLWGCLGAGFWAALRFFA